MITKAKVPVNRSFTIYRGVGNINNSNRLWGISW